MEASSSLKGCTCAFCPPEKQHPGRIVLSEVRKTQALSLLCKLQTTQVSWQRLNLSNLPGVL